jgi:hypothetical protein
MITSTSHALTNSQREWVARRLRELGATRPCPRCSHPDFSLLESVLAIPIGSSSQFPGQWESIRAVVCVCTRCGFLSQHALGVLGQLPLPRYGEQR